MFGIDAAAPAADVATWMIGEDLYWKALTEKGEKLTETVKELLVEADEQPVEAEKDAIHKIVEKLPYMNLSLEGWGGDAPVSYTHLDVYKRQPVIYPYRNECCGGYISLKEKEMSENMCKKITDSAEGFGADMMITACPLCMYNLNKNKEKEIPVYYFTELLAEALGVHPECKEKEVQE